VSERDSGWSEQYAETGGWPPPAAGQRRYGPGTPPADATAATGPADAAGSAEDGSGEDARWGQPAAEPAPDHGRPSQLETGGHGHGGGPWDPPATHREAGPPYQAGGQPTGGYGEPDQWGRPAGQAETGPYGLPDQWGRPAGQAETGPYGQPDQWGRPAGQAETGPYGQPDQWGRPAEAWAPGDPAYGRLGNPTPPARQRSRRPWEGRPAPTRRPGGTPVVTVTLIAICVVLYLVQQANPGFTARYALIPFAVEQGQYPRLITSAFLHASLLHLATNMITLYIVGAPLERVLRPTRYLIVYFLSALGGSLFSVWLSPEFSIGVGASGAIFGLFGALVVLRRQVGAEAGALAVLIGLNLVISFTLPNISWQAHIGGLVTGTLVALALQGIDRISRRRPAT
jgi:membrane associated rhomboid family serine protease